MPRKQSEVLAEKMKALQAEVEVIEGKDEPTEEEVSRSDACMEEFKELKSKYDAALKREAEVEEVLRARLESQSNTESGSGVGTGPTGEFGIRPGVQFMRRTDPYDQECWQEMKRTAYQGPERVNFDVQPVISRALAAVEQMPRGAFAGRDKEDAAKERLTGLLELDNVHAPLIARHMLLTGSEAYRQEFREYIQSQGTSMGELIRTAMSLTAGNGGVLVPFFLDPTIILTNAGVSSHIRSISTTKTIATKAWEGVTSAGVSAEWVGEGTEAADATPSYVQPTITPKHADAWVFGSYEVFQDSGFAAELGRLLADAKVRLEETAFATANTGATIPRGVVAAVAAVTASIVTSATTGAFVIGDVYNTADAVNPRQENNLTWIAHKKIFSKIRQFDTSGGGTFWTNLGAGQPPELLGAPAYRCSPMTSVIGNGNNILLVGDFAEYYVIDRVGMTVIYDPLIRSTGNNRPTGQAGWYAFWRVGADVVNADAFRLLQLNQVAAATALG
jgi:HK97 family phage major capsid protein